MRSILFDEEKFAHQSGRGHVHFTACDPFRGELAFKDYRLRRIAMSPRLIGLVAGILLFAIPLGGQAHGQSFPGGPGGPGGGPSAPDVPPAPDYEQRLKINERLQALGDDLMGDSIDPHTGSLRFSQTDISLPGNSALPVALTRINQQGPLYGSDEAEFSDWSYDVPRLMVVTHVQAPWTGQRCSASFASQFPLIGPTPFLRRSEYSNGIKLHVNGSADHVLEGPNGAPWPSSATHVTNSNWYFTCANSGTTFIGHAPDGSTYRFDRHIERDAQPMALSDMPAAPNAFRTVYRKTHMLMATEVTDIDGNWVRYDYDTSGRLTRIHANDGRSINLTYSGTSKLVASATANGRTWTYSYGGGAGYQGSWIPNNSGGSMGLAGVQRPDGRSWQFNMGPMQIDPPPHVNCLGGGDVSITHPSGIVGEFTISVLKHRQRGTHQNSISPFCPEWDLFIPATSGYWPLVDDVAIPTIGVTRKTLIQANGDRDEWLFEYEQDTVSGTSLSDPTNWTKVTGPEDIKIYRHKWLEENVDSGALVSLEVRDKATNALKQTTRYTYISEGSFGSPSMSFFQNGPTQLSQKRKLMVQQQITLDGATHTTSHTYVTNGGSPTYSFGLPTQIDRSSSLHGVVRTEQIDYRAPGAKWVIGLRDKVRRNGKLFAEYIYGNPAFPSRVTDFRQFGISFRRYSYFNLDTGPIEHRVRGGLAWVEDAMGRRTNFAEWKRGVPERVTNADSTILLHSVDDNGWLSSATDAKGTVTSYGYNSVGWVTLIDRPSPYADTTIGYVHNTNGLVQTITQASKRVTVTTDSFYRPVLEKSEAISGGGLTSYVNYAYDGLGRVVFQSQPSASTTETKGVETTYDALGRVIKVRENVAPFATTLTDYLSGNKVRVTDPAGNQTTTSFHAFGSTDTNQPVKIEEPLGATTDMTYDVWGNLLTARQYGTHSGFTVNQTQHWVYDNALRLCRHHVPETGAKLFEYNNANELIAYAEGQSGTTGCAGSLPASDKVVLTYDKMGRPLVTNFPGSTADIARTYDANGNLDTLARGNTAWDYNYDVMNALTQEILAVDGRVYTTSYALNSTGDLTSMTTPAGRLIAYAPNGLGQPTKASWGSTQYASNVTYHVGGALLGLAYGNGQVLSKTLNDRLLPVTAKTQAGGVKALDLTYAYDVRGKVSGITDGVDASKNRAFTYDARGRLTSATGSWGIESYQYDPLNNIRSRSRSGFALTMAYDGNNRLSLVSGSQSRGYAYDGRGNVIGDSLRAYSYDMANQPIQISGLANGLFTYDGNLKRVKQVVNGETIYTVYGRSGGILYRDNATTGETTDFIRSGGMTLARVSSVGGVSYIHDDHLGSANSATDAAGAILWREEYMPFGEPINDPAANRDKPGFTGHIHDHALGLTYMQARYYDPVIGRFLSNDPVGFAQAGPGYFNRYAYVANDPVNNTDPTGEFAFGLASKVIKIAIKGGDIASTLAGAKEDFGTLTNSGASLGDRALAAASLASEVLSPVSGRDVKAAGDAVSGAISKGGKGGPDFVVTPKGEAISVPDGASGPNPTINKGGNEVGFEFTGGSGGKGMDPRVDGVRIMDANANQGPRVNYMNESRQTVDPASGRTISNDDPRGHIPLED
jgi:RHS repeat-associated protein